VFGMRDMRIQFNVFVFLFDAGLQVQLSHFCAGEGCLHLGDVLLSLFVHVLLGTGLGGQSVGGIVLLQPLQINVALILVVVFDRMGVELLLVRLGCVSLLD